MINVWLIFISWIHLHNPNMLMVFISLDELITKVGFEYEILAMRKFEIENLF